MCRVGSSGYSEIVYVKEEAAVCLVSSPSSATALHAPSPLAARPARGMRWMLMNRHSPCCAAGSGGGRSQGWHDAEPPLPYDVSHRCPQADKLTFSFPIGSERSQTLLNVLGTSQTLYPEERGETVAGCIAANSHHPARNRINVGLAKALQGEVPVGMRGCARACDDIQVLR